MTFGGYVSVRRYLIYIWIKKKNCICALYIMFRHNIQHECYISVLPYINIYIYIHTRIWSTKVKNPKKGCASFYVLWNIMRKVALARPTQTNSSKMLLPQYTKRRRRSNLFFFSCRFVYTTFLLLLIFFSFIMCVREYRCRVERARLDGKENFFFSFT